MLRTRLIVGTVLAALAAGMLLLDERFAPWFPFLFLTVAFLSAAGTVELVRLLPESRRPSMTICVAGVLFLIALNWGLVITTRHLEGDLFSPGDALAWVTPGFAAVVLLTFLAEMATFQGPGGSVERMALTVWTVAYLGVLPSFLIQLRTGHPEATGEELRRGTVALAMAIFIPKACDIGAYFTGRLIGRHRMTPVLSPKKTWEGAAGGMVAALATAVGVSLFGAKPEYYWIKAIGFGLTVGLAGLFGDLAESLVKRESQKKDASQSVPGFGGVLDVIDSVLFAAPLSFFWLATAPLSPLG